MDKVSETSAENKVSDNTRGVTPGLTPKRKANSKGKADKDFPLWLHPSGRWARKIRQKVYYFGKADNPQAALEKWLDQKDDLLAGRTPRAKSDGLLIGDPPHIPDSAVGLVNRFLTAKSHLLSTGEITRRTFEDYKATCQRLVAVFGWSRRVDDLSPEDFEELRANIGKTRGPVALGNEINRTKVILKFAADNRLIPLAVNYGQNFKRPSRKTLRIARVERGPRIFEASEIKRLIGKASKPLKAMILLGINAGQGQSDIAQLPISAIDLKTGWLNYPRPKTGIERRCWLWPETITAIREAIPLRGNAADPTDAGLLFITRQGARWSRMQWSEKKKKWVVVCAITGEFKKLLTALDINGHRGFYGLRRGFETIGGGARDQVAVDHVMGHAPASNDMGAVYRDRLEDDRLVAVAQHVRKWLRGRHEQAEPRPLCRRSQGAQR